MLLGTVLGMLRASKAITIISSKYFSFDEKKIF